MSNRTTLADIRKRAIRRANLQAQSGQSRAVTSDEVNDYINDSYSELHDLLILRYGSDYFVRVKILTIPAQSESFALPDDFSKMKAVYYLQAGTPPYVRIRLKEFMENEREALQSQFVVPFTYGIYMQYRVADMRLELAPVPNSVANVEIRYAYQAPRFTYDADIIELQVCNGWEEYLVIDTAIKMRDTLELDTTRLNVRKQEIYERIKNVASDRDAGQPQRVTDVYGSYGIRRRTL